MILLQAPTIVSDLAVFPQRRLFLAGGISGASDWQSEMVEQLKSLDLLVMNPRRVDYPHDDPDAERLQVRWEHFHLQNAAAVSFWFVPETLCPITLLELGVCIGRGQPIFVGIHPDYARKNNVLMQLELARPEVEVVFSISSLAAQISAWATARLS